MERIQRSLQVNFYNADSDIPTVIILIGTFISEEDAESYAEIYQDYLRILRKDSLAVSKQATVRVRRAGVPVPRSQPMKRISYGTMFPLDKLTEHIATA